MVLLWTLPFFLAVGTAVSTDMYLHGDFDSDQQMAQITEISEIPQVAEHKLTEEQK